MHIISLNEAPQVKKRIIKKLEVLENKRTGLRRVYPGGLERCLDTPLGNGSESKKGRKVHTQEVGCSADQ